MGDYLTVQDIAQRLDVTTDTIRRWLRTGKLKGTPLGRAGYRIHESDFQFFMDRRDENLQQSNKHKHKQPSASKAHSLLPTASSALSNGDDLPALAYNAIFIRDPMSVITAWNQEAARLYGWSEQEALGQMAYALLQTNVPISREEIELQLIQTGHWDGELRSIGRNGQEIIVESHQILRRNAQGQPDSILEIDRDITYHKQLEETLSFLAEASRTLNASLDYETTLQKIATLAIPTLADFCFFDLLHPDQTIQRIASAHIQSEHAPLYDQAFAFTPSIENRSQPVSRVLHSGRPELVEYIDEQWIQQMATSPEHAQFMRWIGLHSMMTVPLIAQNNTLGTLTFCYTISGRHYTHRTLELAIELAHRAGMAIANARLYTEQVHARKQAEAIAQEADRQHVRIEVEETMLQFASLVENSSDMIAMASMQGQTIYMNKAGCDLCGLADSEEARTKPIITYAPESRRPFLKEIVWPQVQATGHWEGDLEILNSKSGELIDVRQTIFIVTNPQTQAPLCLATVARDIHEQKETERRKDTFISMASHELRNPLTTIHANLQLAERRIKSILQQEEEPAPATLKATNEALQMLDRARRQTKVMAHMIGDLLESTRIQANNLNLSLAEHDIIAVMQDTIADQLEITPQRIIQLAPLPDNQDIIVLIDKDRIRQVISNYLANALKYSAANEEITIGITVDGDQIRLWVLDHGPGLTVEQQEHIWDRYYQAKDITVQSGSGIGLGLGLHICKTLISRHGGQVGVDSQKGVGSTFWFQLPLANTLYS